MWLSPASWYLRVSWMMKSGGPAMSAPSRSSGVSHLPESDGSHLERIACSIISRQLTREIASSRVRPGLVIGIAAAVGTGLPASAASLRSRWTRLRKVLKVIRPGIQPSQYSTARRADAGELPQYQIGILRSADGVGWISTLSKL